MGIIKNLWGSRKTYGRHSKPMEVILNKGTHPRPIGVPTSNLGAPRANRTRPKPMEVSQNLKESCKPVGSQKTYGSLQKHMGASQNLWESFKTYGNHKKPMGIIKNLRGSRKTYGSPPKPMGIIKDPWESRKTYGRHRKTYGSH